MNIKVEVEHEFEMLWRKFEHELRVTGGKVDLHVSTQNPGIETVLTAISRIPSELHSMIAGIQNEFREFRSDHYFYPTDNTHFTIRDCTAFLRDPQKLQSTDIGRISDHLKNIFAKFAPFTLYLRGLNVFPTTVYVQVIEPTGTLREMRKVIEEELSSEYVNVQIAQQRLLPNPLLAFVNIIRFKKPVTDQLVDLVKSLRETDLGEFSLDSMELVATDKLLSNKNTLVLDTYSSDRRSSS